MVVSEDVTIDYSSLIIFRMFIRLFGGKCGGPWGILYIPVF